MQHGELDPVMSTSVQMVYMQWIAGPLLTIMPAV